MRSPAPIRSFARSSQSEGSNAMFKPHGLRAMAACLLFAVATDGALAQPLEFDLDGDGRVNRTEFIKGRDARFERLDVNGDRMISLADFPEATRSQSLKELMGRMFAMADMDRDGEVTRNEVGLSGTPLFNEADKDHNDVIEGQELTFLNTQLRR
jgi:hypothetical protein